MKRWQFWIDRGGTFTDCLGLEPESERLHFTKVLSSDRAPLDGIRELLAEVEPDGNNSSLLSAIPACDIRMGTTLATNALLERRGARMGLVITQGFGDALEIGTQARSDIFDLNIVKPGLLYDQVYEVSARVTPQGGVAERHSAASLRAQLEAWLAAGLTSVAVVVLHAYANPCLEQEIARTARAVGFRHVYASHEVANEMGLVRRGDTTCIDAYLTPLLRDYFDSLSSALPGSTLRLMQSSGALTDVAGLRGPHAILSGPAGGVVAYAAIARQHGATPAIGFDMGGTSTDVSRYASELPLTYGSEIAGVRLSTPTLDVHTVAAGGGSVCSVQHGRLQVGPSSVGSSPGPLCYGAPDATELSLTDVNLVLGRLRCDRFPLALDRARPQAALHALAAEQQLTADQLAAGFFRVATSNMAEAIKQVSVARGFDLREHSLVVYGGAAGQHACAIASQLGMRRVLIHPLAGVLSALGMGLADTGWHVSTEVGRQALSQELLDSLAPTLQSLRERALRELGPATDGAVPAPQVEILVDLSYLGSETLLTFPLGSASELHARFEADHLRLFGYQRGSHPIVVAHARARATRASTQRLEQLKLRPAQTYTCPDVVTARIWMSGGSSTAAGFVDDVPVLWREQLTPGRPLPGPAVVLEPTGCVVIDPGFTLHLLSDGTLELLQDATAASEVTQAQRAEPQPPAPDPVLLEIFGNRFMSIAQQMGQVLQRTALSTNIRERLDFSCAIFDPHGNLVANAPHIPVHLGAMSESVRAVLKAHPAMCDGDAFVTNDPAGGGSHLPDITVVTPVFSAGALNSFVASRGHHADIGGVTPGSMPPFSTELAQEGVVLRCLPLVRAGELLEAQLLEALAAGPYPARAPRDNLADLIAQLAANQAGLRLIRELCASAGAEQVLTYMQHIQDHAAALVGAQVATLPDGEHSFYDELDDGAAVRVKITVRGRSLKVDFTGSAPALASNLNAPRAVTIAAVIYVLRALVGRSAPLNAGYLRPVELIIPRGSLLDPPARSAVAGGNVETSQRVVDVLLGALGVAAASQGTMNNLTFGDPTFGYYETIAGGAGASDGCPGASGVQTHMTNTRITDPEVLETRFPVRLLRFALRRGSGGVGRFPGGDGVLREFEFLKPLRVAIISERRARAPFGLAGGGAAQRGENRLNGALLAGKAEFNVVAGDRLLIATPGGGAYGAPDGTGAGLPASGSGSRSGGGGGLALASCSRTDKASVQLLA